MNITPEEIIARLTASKAWDWVPGLLCEGEFGKDFRVLGKETHFSRGFTGSIVTSVPDSRWFPFEESPRTVNAVVPMSSLVLSPRALKDPASLGCIISMLRKAFQSPVSAVWEPETPNKNLGTWFFRGPNVVFQGHSEIIVLLMALEYAGKYVL